MMMIMTTCQVLRYDKLYMGHDVFFYNDKSGRVERLHSAMDSSQSYTRWVAASTVQHSTVQYSTVQHSTVQYRATPGG